MKTLADTSRGLALARWLTDQAVAGIGPLSGAEELAQEYLIDRSFADHDSRVRSLIRWESGKNFTSGFLTGLGGLMTLPVTIPADLGASWVLQTRMVAAIARIYGHDLAEDRVRTAILLVIIGQDLKETLKQSGIRAGKRLTFQLIEKIPGSVLDRINRAVGMRLLAKAGEKGVINLSKLVPVAGGLIGGTVDAVSCRLAGRLAKKVFAPPTSADETPTAHDRSAD